MQTPTIIEPEYKTIWQPIPGTSQVATFGLAGHVDDMLLVGTRGGGKSLLQLMIFLKFVGVGYGEHWKGLIYDLSYKEMDSLISEAKRWFSKFSNKPKFYRSKADLKWVWPTGEELLFRAMADADDYESVHGHQYPFIGSNELTKQPTPELYDLLLSCMRAGFKPDEHSPDPENPLPPIPLMRVSTTNPHGAGHNWVKQRYIDPAPYGHVVEDTHMVTPYGKTEPEELVTKQVTFFSSFRENPYLPATYESQLQRVRDPNRRKAWLTGSWDITSGGIIDDIWEKEIHVVPRFPVPAAWRIVRTLDWGSAHPFSVGWWAIANGEEATFPDGRTWCPRPGSLIRIAEWYGTEEIGTNVGLFMASHDVALGILSREAKLLDEGWITSDPEPGPADSEIYNVRDKSTATIARRMEKYGVEWIKADKSPGSRVNGLQLFRDMICNSVIGEGAGFYVTQNCTAFQATVVPHKRDKKNPDDASTVGEDHIYDDSRYMVLHVPPEYAKVIKLRHPSSA